MKKKALILSGVAWDETWQRHQQFAEYLIKSDYEVFFVEHIISSKFTLKKTVNVIRRKEGVIITKENKRLEGLNLIRERFVNPQEGLFKLWNFYIAQKLVSKIGNEFDVIINYLPINTTRFILDAVKGKKVVYDCVRNFIEWDACSYPDNIEEEEKELIKRVDMVLTDSYYLTDKMRKLTSKCVKQFLPIINDEWCNGIYVKEVPSEICNIGYFGTYSDVQNDGTIYSGLNKLGKRILIWGSVSGTVEFDFEYEGYKNNLKELSKDIITKCDALVLAYKGNMDGVIPAKIMQAISTGLPVFVSDFYDMRMLDDFVYVFHDMNDLKNQIQKFDSHVFLKKKELINDFIKDKRELEQYEQFISTI